MKRIPVKILVLAFVCFAGAQNSFARGAPPNAKKQLVSKLVAVTFPIYPAALLENGTREMTAQMRENFIIQISDSMYSQIDANDKLSAERKAAAKAKVPLLVDNIGARLTAIISRNLNLSQWIKESLAHSFLRQFTVAELRKLTAFVRTRNGKVFLDAVQKEAADETQETKSPLKIDDGDAPEVEAFLKSPLGAKFFNVFDFTDSDKFLDGKIKRWSKATIKNLEYEIKGGEIHRMMNAFVAENLK